MDLCKDYFIPGTSLPGNPKRSTKKPTTLSANLRTQLQTLIAIIKNRRTHYVFCIKPNEAKQPRTFELALVQHQVRYMSLMPLVNLCRTGHCFHLSHGKFFNRYKLLNSVTWPHFQNGNTVEGIALIIRNVPLPSAEFTIGTKNVFIRSPRTVSSFNLLICRGFHTFAAGFRIGTVSESTHGRSSRSDTENLSYAYAEKKVSADEGESNCHIECLENMEGLYLLFTFITLPLECFLFDLILFLLHARFLHVTCFLCMFA